MEIVASRKKAQAWLLEGELGKRTCRQGDLIYLTVQKDGGLFFEGADPNGQVRDRVVRKLPKGKYMISIPHGMKLSLEQAEWYLNAKSPDGPTQVKATTYRGRRCDDDINLFRLKTIVQFKQFGEWKDHCAQSIASLGMDGFIAYEDGDGDGVVNKASTPSTQASPSDIDGEEKEISWESHELNEIREHLAIDEDGDQSIMSKIIAYETENDNFCTQIKKLDAEVASLKRELEEARAAEKEATAYCRLSSELGINSKNSLFKILIRVSNALALHFDDREGPLEERLDRYFRKVRQNQVFRSKQILDLENELAEAKRKNFVLEESHRAFETYGDDK